MFRASMVFCFRSSSVSLILILNTSLLYPDVSYERNWNHIGNLSWSSCCAGLMTLLTILSYLSYPSVNERILLKFSSVMTKPPLPLQEHIIQYSLTVYLFVSDNAELCE